MQFDNGIHVVALSDGAGSSRYSQYGSYLAVNRSMNLISSHFDEAFALPSSRRAIFKHRLIEQLLLDLSKLAAVGIDLPTEERQRLGISSREGQLLVPCDLKDLSCTLLLVAVKGNRYLAFHVGDGVIGIESERGARRRALSILSSPSNGEFANETVFLTSGSVFSSARLICGRLDSAGRKITGFILMSDGPEAALYHKRNKSLGNACLKLFDASRRLDRIEMESQLIASIDAAIKKKTMDDCSLALLTR